MKRQKFSSDFQQWITSDAASQLDWPNAYVKVKKSKPVELEEGELPDEATQTTTTIELASERDLNKTLRECLESAVICEYPCLYVHFG